MSNSPSPQPGMGYFSPGPTATPPTQVSSKPSSSRNTPKPANVFTNDGSFLERIQRTKKEEDEKQKEQEALEKKKNFDSRFKNRGKRPPPDPTPSSGTPNSVLEDPPAKKAKFDGPTAEYAKQLKTFESRSGMKDTGTGIRPLVK
ncbi:hypothetical protein FPV67DRAFT_1666744 [Lyophyllum atratum]|nr:hypothetical protein FPV67DRAFT_1666744 [Lyophyllum atratum]